MRVQHHARHTLGTRLRRKATVGLIAAALAVPVAGIMPLTASAQPAPPAPPAAPAAPAAPQAPAAPGGTAGTPAVPGAPEAPAVPGLPGVPGAPLAESATSITLTVNGLEGDPIAVSVDATATVEDLKILIEEQTGVPAGEQRLVTDSEVELMDSRTLASYDLTDGAIVNLEMA